MIDKYKYIIGRTRNQGKKFNAKQIFDEAGLAVASDPALLKRRLEDHFDRVYGVLEDPDEVRDLLLQVRSEDEWKTPQVFSDLRKERVNINGQRNMVAYKKNNNN